MTPIPLPHGELDLHAAEVRTAEQTHSLTDREVRLLTLLAATPGQPVTRQAIADHLGVHSGLGPLLSDLLWRLRKKLEPDPKQPSVLLRHAGGSLIAHWGTTETQRIRLTDVSGWPIVRAKMSLRVRDVYYCPLLLSLSSYAGACV